MSLRSARTTTLGALTYGLIGLGAFAQPAPGGEPIVVGQRFELRSVRMNEPRTFLVHRADLNADVFLAADDSPGMGLSGAWELSSYLNERATRVRDLRFMFRRYAESHATVPLPSVYEGLQTIFDGWSLDIDDAFALSEKGGFAAIEQHFATLSTRLGFPVEVPQDALLAPFYELEGSKRFAEAESVIERVIESFPDDPAPLYYAGRLYMQMGDRARAIETLRQSLRLSPDYGASRGLLEYMNADRDE